MSKIPEPLSAQEQFLYGINKRLEVLIDQFSSLIEHIASKESVATEKASTEVDPSLAKKTRVRKVN